MQQLGSKSFTVNGVQVFSDHADPDQFWYLPGPVKLARRGPNNDAQFTLIKYRPAVADAGIPGGGFLMIETELALDEQTEKEILTKCAGLSNGQPRLSVVPFDSGTVQCIALNLQGPGGTSAAPAGSNAPTFVEQILGASNPSLQGNESAAFSLTLDQSGATVMEQVFKEGGGPVGVIYQLRFTILRPSLDVEITLNYKRVYDSLKLGLDFGAGFVAGGVPIYLRAGLDAAFEKLKQEGKIQIKVINFSNAADAADKEKWALDFLKDKLLAEWFQPTLPPVQFPSQATSGVNIPGIGNLPANIPGLGNLAANIPGLGGNTGGTQPGGGGQSGTQQGGGAQSGGSSHAGSSSQPGSGAQAGSGSQPGGGSQQGGGSQAGAGSQQGGSSHAGTGSQPGGTSQPAGGSQPGSAGASSASHPEAGGAASLPQAVLSPAMRTPADAASDYRIEFTPSSAGTQETLTFQGGGQPPVVSINGTQRTLNGRQLTLDLAAGTTLNLRAEYPPPPALPTAFIANFHFEDPEASGFSSIPPSPLYQGYLNDSSPDATWNGNAARIRNWIQTQLADPKQVTVDSYASFEGNNSRAAFNLALTQRRRQVAIGVIGNLAQVSGGDAHGFTEAQAAGRVGDPNDRRVVIRGMGRPGNPVTLTATLARAAAPATTPQGGGQPGGSQPGGSQPAGGQAGGGQPGGSQPGGAPGMGVSLAFKMQIVNQEEDKEVTVRYTRTEAVQQSYNPQGFIGLLTQDIGPGHFFDIDLDSFFFRTIDIVADAPIDFDRIGLISAQLALDYGDPTDPEVGVKHKDMTFDKTSPMEQKFSTFMDRRKDTSYKLGTQYHFDPLSGWEGEKLSYELPVKTTEDRTLLVNPFEDFGFLELHIIPGDIDWCAVKDTDVHLHYEDPGVFSKDTVVSLRPDSQEQVWKLRLTNVDQRTITYFFEHHLIDGSVRTSPTRTTTASTIAVDDSFEDALDIEFIPIFDRNSIRSVFAEILYQDTAHNYKREARLEFGGAGGPVSIPAAGSAGSGSSGSAAGTVGSTVSSDLRQRLHIALFDASQDTYQITYTIVGNDNSIRRLNPISTNSTMVFVGETF